MNGLSLIPFHPKVTVITGANGSGKSTIIRLLARQLGWGYQECATPTKNEKTGLIGFFTRFLPRGWLGKESRSELDLGMEIGSLSYSSGQIGKIVVPAGSGATYVPSVSVNVGIRGLHIPAHRPQFLYQAVNQIGTVARTKQDAYNQSFNNCQQSALSGGTNRSSFVIKETLISWATYGYGNEVIEAETHARRSFEEFQEILKTILPKTLGFKEIAIRKSEVLLICTSGEFMLDACSGGISALVDLAWQVFTFQTDATSPFVVIIDEAENHLHAAMQRSLLPSFMEAFPNAQFIVTTHSPFIVGSVKDSNVIALDYGVDSRVSSQVLDLVNKASTASEILRDVLGVPLTLPIWVEHELDATVEKFVSKEITEESIKALSDELKRKHLDHLVPTAITQFLDKKSGVRG